MHAAQGPSGPAIRQHARVTCSDVAAGVRIEGTDEWVQVRVGDLSLGGALLLTDRFIVEGTQLDVGLAFPSGIRLFFVAEVVRAVPESPRGPGGLGLRFFPTTPENERALARELEPRMQAAPAREAQAPTSPPPSSAPASGGGVELTTSIYDRLRLPPDCDAEVLAGALERLIASLEASLEAIPPGQQRDQAQVFKQTLERMRPLCQDPLKRVAYDFNHGYVRAEERIAAAAMGSGPPLSKLQEVWKRIFANEVREARRLFAESRKGGPDAAQLLEQARQLDPFNPQLQALPPDPPLVAGTPLPPAPAVPHVAAPPVAAPPAAPPPAAPPAVSPSPFAATAPATAPNPFGQPPAPQPSPPAEPARSGESDDDDDLPLVEPDDFFGGLES